MSRKVEIFFVSFIFLLAIAYVSGIIFKLNYLLALANSAPTPQQTLAFLAMLFLGFLVGYVVITVFVNVFLKKCDCCRGRGLVKKVIFAGHHADVKTKEYEFCFRCRIQESWKKHEELIHMKDYSIIHISLI